MVKVNKSSKFINEDLREETEELEELGFIFNGFKNKLVLKDYGKHREFNKRN